jgi:hypothetical protein|tara:strand:- start:2016 stop:2147 length:132 start_codon:yes stop_codon:yes gene_type:complete
MSNVGLELKRELQKAARREKQQRILIAAITLTIILGVIIRLTN